MLSVHTWLWCGGGFYSEHSGTLEGISVPQAGDDGDFDTAVEVEVKRVRSRCVSEGRLMGAVIN